ncbi:MAG: hypothetical protein M1835_002245, partial [Candelina submexicana]
PFAESGQAVGAEDIKAYFEKLRGDAEAIKSAGGAALGSDGGGGLDEGDNRREQGGELKHRKPVEANIIDIFLGY